MATHFDDLTPANLKGEAVRKLLSGEVTLVQAALANGLIQGLTVDDLPTAAQLLQIKNYLRTLGLTDSLIGKINILDTELGEAVFSRDITGATVPQQIAGAGAVSRIEAKKFLGFAKEEIDNQKKIQALTNPGDYLRRKNEDIARINNESLVFYQDAVRKYSTEYGYDQETAMKKAKDAANAVHGELMKQHRIEYPSEFQNIAEGKLKKKN